MRTFLGFAGAICLVCFVFQACSDDCVKNVSTICSEGVTYWLDSCGNRGDKARDCECGCDSKNSDCRASCGCIPECRGSCCGPDGCGGDCLDNCTLPGQTCNTQTCTCEGGCEPDCQGRECGSDGCGGSCMPGCGAGTICNENTGLCNLEFVQLSVGREHACVIKTDRTLWCWGANFTGQLGDGTKEDRLTAVQEARGDSDWFYVSAGDAETCALKKDETVWCWGSPNTVPTRLSSGGSERSFVAVGGGHACTVKNDGTLWCWGSNFFGELGDGTNVMKTSPTQEALRYGDWLAVDAGVGHTCAIRRSGSLYCWGWNDDGQLGTGSYGDRNVPTLVSDSTENWSVVSAGKRHTCALKFSGAVWCWGDNSSGQLGNGTNEDSLTPVQEISMGINWEAVSAGEGHTCALKANGTLWCWGSNLYGKLGDGTAEDKSVPIQEATGASDWISLGTGENHSCAAKRNGTVWCWGDSTPALGQGSVDPEHRTEPTQEAHQDTDWVSATTGNIHSCAIKPDSSLWCWGLGSYGVHGDGTTGGKTIPSLAAGGTNDWASVSAGGFHTCAVKNDQTLWCFGSNWIGQIGDGTQEDRLVPTMEASEDLNWHTVATGYRHSCGVKNDGTLWCWGENTDGQLGDGTKEDRTSPTQEIRSDTDWSFVGTGSRHTCALKTDGTIWCWGDNDRGKLGDDTIDDKTEPTQEALGHTNWTTVSAGGDHTCALKSDGTLWCWGGNGWGQIGDGAEHIPTQPHANDRHTATQEIRLDADWTSVSTGIWHTCAVKTNGTLWCWGDNREAALGDGTMEEKNIPTQEARGDTDWVSAHSASSGSHNCAIKANGTLWCWGTSRFGEIGDGTGYYHTPLEVLGL